MLYTGPCFIRAVYLALAAFAGGLSCAPARADDFAGQFFIEQAYGHAPSSEVRGAWPKNAAPLQLTGARYAVRQMIASHVAAHMGPQWVSAVLHIVRIESGFRCNAYNRGHYGLFQVAAPRQFGVSPHQAMTCDGGLAVGVAYLQRCLRMGARSQAMLEACENSGSPFTPRRRLERAYRRA